MAGDETNDQRARRKELVEQALRALEEAAAELRSLVAIQREYTANAERLSKLAAEQLQEMNMSFNMQYLALQQKMQDENRRFTLISNIMKTKHDTAKNSISNIR